MSPPSMPAPASPTTPPPPPTAVDPSVLAARSNMQANAAMAQGRGSTILTGSQGDASLNSNTNKASKTLLGQ